MGMADEGERISTIVDEMEREDLDNEQAEDDASSDKEGDVMSTDWTNEDFSGLAISEGHHVPWEYKDNEVIKGATYAHKEDMKEAVKYWAVSLMREGVKSTNYVYEVRGQLLTAIGVDGNNQLLPMAFAFIESENTESWYWFLDRVQRKVVCMRPNVCLILDRHAGMLRAIDYLQNGWDEKGIPAKWPDVQSRCCMRHMGANFYKQFKNKHLMDPFKRLCAQNQEKKFNELWNKLDELTTKQTDEQSRRLQAEAEVYNLVMRGVRGLPLVGIVEFILHGAQAYFRDRYKKIDPSMVDNKIIFGSVVTKYMEDKIAKAQRHRVVAQGTKVHRRGIMRKHAVQECVLKSDGGCSCTYMKPKLRHLPCSHILAVAGDCERMEAPFLEPSLMVQTRGMRFFQCANLDQEEVRKCQFVQWIDTVRVTSIGQTITQPETTTQFIQAWMEYEHQGNPGRCAFTLWIDNVNPTYDGQKITESETLVEYQREKEH
uniref:SWIM zinc finger family protein n=1 Tax=Oryza sativa subsp. japonica TaxID=39947 RepID=Q2QT94_ORYSJ|nr:SWIM zinc finger family protein [Oryza sativa Japonica Group]